MKQQTKNTQKTSFKKVDFIPAYEVNYCFKRLKNIKEYLLIARHKNKKYISDTIILEWLGEDKGEDYGVKVITPFSSPYNFKQKARKYGLSIFAGVDNTPIGDFPKYRLMFGDCDFDDDESFEGEFFNQRRAVEIINTNDMPFKVEIHNKECVLKALKLLPKKQKIYFCLNEFKSFSLSVIKRIIIDKGNGENMVSFEKVINIAINGRISLDRERLEKEGFRSYPNYLKLDIPNLTKILEEGGVFYFDHSRAGIENLVFMIGDRSPFEIVNIGDKDTWEF